MSTHLINKIYGNIGHVAPNGTLIYYWNKLKQYRWTSKDGKIVYSMERVSNDSVKVFLGQGSYYSANNPWVYRNRRLYYDSGELTLVFRIRI